VPQPSLDDLDVGVPPMGRHLVKSGAPSRGGFGRLGDGSVLMSRKLVCAALSGVAGLGMAWTLTTTIEAAAAVITGTPGDDRLIGTSRDDDIDGRAGDDVISGRDGGDHLVGRSGNDEIHGGPGPDGLFGLKGRDLLHAGRGPDFAEPGLRADRVWLRGGDDVAILERDGHRDVIRCGGGQDQVLYLTARDPKDRLFRCEVVVLGE